MIHQFNNRQTSAEFSLIYDENSFDRIFYGRDNKDRKLTIAWNRGPSQQVTIDNLEYDFPTNSVLCLMANETFHFSSAKDIVAWQFNRDFYCIVDHDKEVSCVGFLFFGSSEKMFISLDSKDQAKAEMTLQLFRDEFETSDHIQGEMMQVLLKRLIIIMTRLGKEQYFQDQEKVGDKIDIIRNYNFLVENNFRKEHQVKYYADKLNKSPKTLSNLFALNNYKSPVLLIQERIFLEAKRLFYYTDKTSKEIAYELGFENANHFSKFFTKHAGVSPTEFRKLSPLGSVLQSA